MFKLQTTAVEKHQTKTDLTCESSSGGAFLLMDGLEASDQKLLILSLLSRDEKMKVNQIHHI